MKWKSIIRPICEVFGIDLSYTHRAIRRENLRPAPEFGDKA